MRFSIVVPSFNQCAYLSATLDSLFTQTGVELEVIVKDGGSTDGSVELLQNRPERFRWTSGRDGGQTDAINAGLRETTGDILAYLNSDDVYLPGALASVQRYFEQNPTCEIVYGDAYHLHPDGSVMEPYPTQPWDYERLQYTCFICQPAVFWRRSLMERIGTFDERLSFAMDYDYWLRAGRRVQFGQMAGEFLAGSRLHAETKTLGQRVRVHREITEVVRAHATSDAPVLHWLKHLASITATERGDPSSPEPRLNLMHVRRFASWMFVYSEQLQILLDQSTLDQLDQLLNDAERACLA